MYTCEYNNKHNNCVNVIMRNYHSLATHNVVYNEFFFKY